MRIIFLLIGLLGASVSNCMSQSVGYTEMVVQLAGNHSREWQLDSVDEKYGDSCNTGQVLVFYRGNNRLQEYDCDGKRHVYSKQDLNWKLVDNKGTWLVSIGRREYELVFRRVNGRKAMVLREYVPGAMEKRVDRIYYSTQ